MTFKAFFPTLSSISRIPNLQAWMPDDLRWSWCNDDRKWTINVVNLNHPQTTPFPWPVEKFCLSRNRSLMPKRLGTTALLDQEVGCCLLSYIQREEMEILPSSSLWLLISFYILASSDTLSVSFPDCKPWAGWVIVKIVFLLLWLQKQSSDEQVFKHLNLPRWSLRRLLGPVASWWPCLFGQFLD